MVKSLVPKMTVSIKLAIVLIVQGVLITFNAINEDVCLLLKDDDMLFIHSIFEIDYVFAPMLVRIGNEGSSDGVVPATAILSDHELILKNGDYMWSKSSSL